MLHHLQMDEYTNLEPLHIHLESQFWQISCHSHLRLHIHKQKDAEAPPCMALEHMEDWQKWSIRREGNESITIQRLFMK